MDLNKKYKSMSVLIYALWVISALLGLAIICHSLGIFGFSDATVDASPLIYNLIIAFMLSGIVYSERKLVKYKIEHS